MKGGGWSVTSGDFNGDGLADVVTGSIYGNVHVHFGKQYFKPVPDQTLLGPAGESLFGFQVASAGDVDKDGFDDLLVALDWGMPRDPNGTGCVCTRVLFRICGNAGLDDRASGRLSAGWLWTLHFEPPRRYQPRWFLGCFDRGRSFSQLSLHISWISQGIQSAPNRIISFDGEGGVLNLSHIGMSMGMASGTSP